MRGVEARVPLLALTCVLLACRRTQPVVLDMATTTSVENSGFAGRVRFLVVGPPDDPAYVRGAANVIDAFRRLAASNVTFVSRGDQYCVATRVPVQHAGSATVRRAMTAPVPSTR